MSCFSCYLNVLRGGNFHILNTVVSLVMLQNKISREHIINLINENPRVDALLSGLSH